MADISIEFHATREENASFIIECAKEFNLHLAAIRFPPFEIALLKKESVHEALSDSGVRQLALTVEKPSLPAEVLTKFLDKNPDAMLLDVGRLTNNRLEESWLTARTSDAKVFALWKQVARKLKLRTQVGAVVINPENGAKGKDRAHRFTSGAKALQDQGVVMIPLAGGCIFKLGNEE